MSRTSFVTMLALACMQLVGILVGSDVLVGLGAASAASPAPKVFTSRAGLESFSSEYRLVLRTRSGRVVRLALTAERYANLEGPYNRRNPYGAVLAFAPVLRSDPRTRSAFDAVARHALCGRAPLLRELGLAPAAFTPTRVIVQAPRPGTSSELPMTVEVHCDAP